MMTFPIYGKIKNGNQTTNQMWMADEITELHFRAMRFLGGPLK